MRTLILGAGGTGGYYGGRLVQSGADVTFLVRPARAEKLRETGLVIRSPIGDATLPIELVTADKISQPYDLIILSSKAYDLDSAIEAIRPAVGANTLILPLLNGIGHLDRLDAAFGAPHVLGGVAYISSTMGPTGEVVHLGSMAGLVFGARSPEQAPGCDRIAELMSHANFDARMSSEVLHDMWEKYAFLSVLAGMTCLMRGSVGEILATRDGEAVMLGMLAESESVSAAQGYPIRSLAHERSLKMLTERGSAIVASMRRDIDAGANVEVGAIVGDMLERGRAAHLSMPLFQAAHVHLQVYQGQRQARGNA